MVETREDHVDGLLVAWREAPDRDPGSTPILWLHGVPDSSEVWTPLLERAGGIAVDLPGFGRSAKPPDWPYSIDGYAAFIERFCDHLGLERVRLVCHDWGAVGLAFAQRRPERIERLAAIDVVPFLPGYRWHRVARAWRTPVVGELTMGFTSARTMRRATGMPSEWVESVMRHFDHGTQRAILRLYRSAGPDVLARAGERLGAISADSLVIWGEEDRYIPPRFAHALVRALGGDAEGWVVPGAGHWCFLERPEVADRLLRFV